MSLYPKTVVAIIGTTGVGKTKLSIEIARKLGSEIINVDAMQMYKGFDLITNKATKAEREAAPHHLIDFVDINKEYTIKDFEKDALAKIDSIHNKGLIPVLVGGTHYYLQSLLWTSSLIPSGAKLREFGVSSNEIKSPLSELQSYWSTLDNSKLHNELIKVDPKMAEHWHVNDRRKVLRSLEIYHETGKTQSSWILERAESEEESKKLRFNTIFFWVYANKLILDLRLDQRVNKMVEGGLFEELTLLKNSLHTLPWDQNDYDRGIKQAIGFKAFDPYLQALISGQEEPKICSRLKQEGLEIMKQQTRRYAKKQIYWIKNQLLPLYFNSPQYSVEKNHEDSNNYKTKLYLLDATDLASWDENVRDKSFSVLDDILNKKVVPDPLLFNVISSQYLTESSKSKLEPVVASWKKRLCEECSRRIDRKTRKLVDPVIINGDREWEDHIKSKRHRKQVVYNKHKALVELKNTEAVSDTVSPPQKGRR